MGPGIMGTEETVVMVDMLLGAAMNEDTVP